jgi:hypothetical protein
MCANPGGGCPLPRPLLGTSCSPEGQQCDYGVCNVPGGAAEQCSGGLWIEALVACPVIGVSP